MESCEECKGERRVVDIEVNPLAGWKASVQRSSQRDRVARRKGGMEEGGKDGNKRLPKIPKLMDRHRNRGELMLQ
jgi:hypothetical protein